MNKREAKALAYVMGADALAMGKLLGLSRYSKMDQEKILAARDDIVMSLFARGQRMEQTQRWRERRKVIKDD